MREATVRQLGQLVIVAGLLLQMGATAVSSTRPGSGEEEVRAHRGRHVRMVLRHLLDQSAENGGVWPEKLATPSDAVIVAVRDDSVPSIGEMGRRLDERRKKWWGGRDLPFLVALDGGGDTPIPGTGLTARGATTAAYGITRFPTTLVIGRDGKVLEEVNVRLPAARDRILAALASRSDK